MGVVWDKSILTNFYECGKGQKEMSVGTFFLRVLLNEFASILGGACGDNKISIPVGISKILREYGDGFPK